jgi:hypothetical protein
MKISSRGLGRKELVMDFRRYEIRREGDDVVVAGTITEPVKWDFSIRMTPGDIPGMIRIAISPRTFGLGVRWAIGLAHRSTAQPPGSTAQPHRSTAQPPGSTAQPHRSTAQPPGSIRPEASLTRKVLPDNSGTEIPAEGSGAKPAFGAKRAPTAVPTASLAPHIVTTAVHGPPVRTAAARARWTGAVADPPATNNRRAL